MSDSQSSTSRPERSVTLRINRQEWCGAVPAGEVLLDTLRDRLGLTGTKRACEEQVCGACTVLVDGAAISSCSYLTLEAAGREVLTIEGLERDGELDPVQESFIRQGALQCGFCTPGFILTTKALLMDEPSPDRETIRSYLHGNICRCASYPAIESAIMDLVEQRAAQFR